MQYNDVRSVDIFDGSSVHLSLDVMRQIGQDLRSSGKPSYRVLTDYIFKNFNNSSHLQCQWEIDSALQDRKSQQKIQDLVYTTTVETNATESNDLLQEFF